MRVGFIHGVMNTDNTSISGESFDYGPCAFINRYSPEAVYSSIDYYGRYAFGNQPKIIKWNISRFAETLLPIIHQNKEKSLQLTQSVIDDFDDLWNKKYYGMMLNKIGIKNNNKILYPLIDELLYFMQKFNKDYNNTFWSLSQDDFLNNKLMNNTNFILWYKKWQKNLNRFSNIKEAQDLMKKNNPIIIPRNHLVEEALEEASNGSINSFQKLLHIISNPYQHQDDLEKFIKPPEVNFEKNFQTYCGT